MKMKDFLRPFKVVSNFIVSLNCEGKCLLLSILIYHMYMLNVI